MAILSVPIMLDKQRNLKYGFGSMIALEDLTGKGFLEIVQELQEKPTIKTVRDIIWAGLVHEDKELTPESVTNILDDSDIQDLLGKIYEAVGLATESKKSGNSKAGATKDKENVTPA